MKKDESDTFELDELAATTHTPPGWPILTIELVPIDKAPKKYGPTTYRFGAAMTLSVILPRRGWTLVKKTKAYAYLVPPPDQNKQPFYISIAVPTEQECLALASRSYAKGQSWFGQLGEWPASYLHERNTSVEEIWRDPVSGEMVSRHHKNPPESSLSIGEGGAWSIYASGVSGVFALPSSLRLVTASLARDEKSSREDYELTLREGALKTVELTTYERNASARRLCIEHYGPKCQACHLNYEDKYGGIGADLIHVHHVVPLSAMGEEYQVNPVFDLIPLCATCHHVAHSKNPPYSVAEIAAAIRTRMSAGR